MHVLEDSVLQPKDPGIQSSDKWPCFALKDVNVVSQQTGEQASLLSAHKANPVTVTGRLEEIEDEQVFRGSSITHVNLPALRSSDPFRSQDAQLYGADYQARKCDHICFC